MSTIFLNYSSVSFSYEETLFRRDQCSPKGHLSTRRSKRPSSSIILKSLIRSFWVRTRVETQFHLISKLRYISIKPSFSYDAHERRLKATIDWGDLPVNWSPKAFRWEFDFVFTPDFVELESGTERHFSKDGKMIKEYFYPDQPYMRLGKAFIFFSDHYTTFTY